jgi:hypothetical protein
MVGHCPSMAGHNMKPMGLCPNKWEPSRSFYHFGQTSSAGGKTTNPRNIRIHNHLLHPLRTVTPSEHVLPMAGPVESTHNGLCVDTKSLSKGCSQPHSPRR